MKNNSIKKDFTSDVANIDFNSPHFEQQRWNILMNMCDALMLQVKQQNKQIIKLNGELKNLKN